MENGIKNYKRARLLKRLGIIGASVAAVAITFVVVLSLLPRYNDAFTIQIDDISGGSGGSGSDARKTAHFVMSNDEEGERKASYFRGTPLGGVKTVETRMVKEYIDGLEQLTGPQNYVDEDGNERAVIYTVYLTNTSEEEEQIMKYAVSLDGYSHPSNGAFEPIEYFRILARTHVVGSDELPVETYFGNRRTEDMRIRYDTEIEDQSREPISSRNFTTLENILVKDFISNGNDGFCINFDDGAIETKKLISDVELRIPAGKTLQFTFAAYFESKDLDCEGVPPKDAYLLLSLHFGI